MIYKQKEINIYKGVNLSQKVPKLKIKRILDHISSYIHINALIPLLILISFGIIGSITIMKLSFIDSIYFTIITIATLGYGDIVPVTILQKIFSFLLAIGGVGLVTKNIFISFSYWRCGTCCIYF